MDPTVDRSTAEYAASRMKFMQDRARRLFEKNGMVTAVFFIEGKENHAIGTDMGDKDALARFIKTLVVASEAFCIMQVSECWMAKFSDGDEKKVTGSLEHVSGRTECIMITVEHKAADGGHLSCFAEIKRDGNRATLGEWQNFPITEGRFMRFLPNHDLGYS